MKIQVNTKNAITKAFYEACNLDGKGRVLKHIRLGSWNKIVVLYSAAAQLLHCESSLQHKHGYTLFTKH